MIHLKDKCELHRRNTDFASMSGRMAALLVCVRLTVGHMSCDLAQKRGVHSLVIAGRWGQPVTAVCAGWGAEVVVLQRGIMSAAR